MVTGEKTDLLYENILVTENLVTLFAAVLIVIILAAVFNFSDKLTEMGDEKKHEHRSNNR